LWNSFFLSSVIFFKLQLLKSAAKLQKKRQKMRTEQKENHDSSSKNEPTGNAAIQGTLCTKKPLTH
jgi:hypothetical protein